MVRPTATGTATRAIGQLRDPSTLIERIMGYDRRHLPPVMTIILATLVWIPTTARAIQEPLWGGPLVDRIDSIAELTLAEGQVSGLSIGVKRGNDLLLAHGYGFADLENLVPASAQTIYGIGSVTKQFTAAAIMQLVERDDVSLDDAITRFLPDYPTQGHTVTIRHLLTHTSGIKTYPDEETPEGELAVDLRDEELRALFENEPFDFAPGDRFRYSNSAYVLLGMIVAAASGQSYAEYMDRHVFGPVGLVQSSFCDTQRIVPGRARGYWIEDGELVNAAYLSMTHPGAAGALCSTVLDLLSWTSALRAGRVVSPASYEAMITPAVLNDGSTVNYGFGLRVDTRLEGHRSISHGGGINGYQTELAYYPDADIDIAVISNTNGLHVRRIADTIAKWALGIHVPVVLDKSRSAEELEVYVGVYRIAEREYRIVRRGSQLFLEIEGRLPEPSRLRSQGNHIFVPQYSDYARLTFTLDGRDVIGFSLHECVPSDQERCRTLDGARVR